MHFTLHNTHLHIPHVLQKPCASCGVTSPIALLAPLSPCMPGELDEWADDVRTEQRAWLRAEHARRYTPARCHFATPRGSPQPAQLQEQPQPAAAEMKYTAGGSQPSTPGAGGGTLSSANANASAAAFANRAHPAAFEPHSPAATVDSGSTRQQHRRGTPSSTMGTTAASFAAASSQSDDSRQSPDGQHDATSAASPRFYGAPVIPTAPPAAAAPPAAQGGKKKKMSLFKRLWGKCEQCLFCEGRGREGLASDQLTLPLFKYTAPHPPSPPPNTHAHTLLYPKPKTSTGKQAIIEPAPHHVPPPRRQQRQPAGAAPSDPASVSPPPGPLLPPESSSVLPPGSDSHGSSDHPGSDHPNDHLGGHLPSSLALRQQRLAQMEWVQHPRPDHGQRVGHLPPQHRPGASGLPAAARVAACARRRVWRTGAHACARRVAGCVRAAGGCGAGSGQGHGAFAAGAGRDRAVCAAAPADGRPAARHLFGDRAPGLTPAGCSGTSASAGAASAAAPCRATAVASPASCCPSPAAAAAAPHCAFPPRSCSAAAAGKQLIRPAARQRAQQHRAQRQQCRDQRHRAAAAGTQRARSR